MIEMLLPVCNAIRLNLNQPFAIDETRHLDEGGGRLDCGEKLAVPTNTGPASRFPFFKAEARGTTARGSFKSPRARPPFHGPTG